MGLTTMRRVTITSIAILISLFVGYGPTPIALANNSAVVATAANCACPFCSAISLTFSEQMNSSDIVVVAKLIEIPPPPVGPDADFPKAKFEILKPLKGEKFVGQGLVFKTQLVGNYPIGQKFLIMGVDPPNIAWTTPMKAADRVFTYLEKLQKLPESGPDRLVFFQDYFEDKESVLAFDAYDEFAGAPYEDLIGMKDQMQHDKLIGWIQDPDTSVTRKRLYFTMLGVCGTKDDVKLLEDLINSGSRKKRAGLDALIASYLMLKGEAGVDLIEKTFLIDKEVDYVDTLAAVSALRFHGTEAEVVPKKRIVKAIRHLLDRPKMADMIIPDLARWEDWSVMERLVEMFKNADPESNWLRVPVITYLRSCPKPEAKQFIAELQKIDPEAVQRADFFLGFDDEDDWGDDDSEESEKKEQTEKESKDDGGGAGGLKTESAADSGKSSDVTDSRFVTPERQGENFVVNNRLIEPNDQGTFASEAAAQTANSDGPLQKTQTSTAGPAKPAAIEPTPTKVVSSTPDAAVAQPTPPPSADTVSPLAPVAASSVALNLTWFIIFVPMAAAAVIFVLLWSVVNGWFERLIF